MSLLHRWMTIRPGQYYIDQDRDAIATHSTPLSVTREDEKSNDDIVKSQSSEELFAAAAATQAEAEAEAEAAGGCVDADGDHDNMKVDVVMKFTNCRVVRNGELVVDDVWVFNGKIIDPAVRFWQAQGESASCAADVLIDCKGNILAPGFIDIQLNGAFGIDFTTPSHIDQCDDEDESDDDNLCQYEDGITSVARGLLYQGVTSFVPTVITSSPETYRKIIPIISNYCKRQAHERQCVWTSRHTNKNSRNTSSSSSSSFSSSSSSSKSRQIRPSILHMRSICSSSGYSVIDGDDPSLVSQVLGIHNEGPFISVLGAHPESLTRIPVQGYQSCVDTYGDLENVKIITLAPELKGCMNAISELNKRGIKVSAGHSRATLADTEEAVANGVSLITHLFNAMVPFHHRDPGIIGLLGSPKSQAVHFGIIADGHHAHPASVRIAFETNPSRILLVTDAMCAMGLKAGEYSFGTLSIQVLESDGTARIKGTDTLAGSTATMDSCVKNFATFTKCGPARAIEAASTLPARALGCHEKGTLNVGAEADIVILDDDFRLHGVWVHGKRAWHHHEALTITFNN